MNFKIVVKCAAFVEHLKNNCTCKGKKAMRNNLHNSFKSIAIVNAVSTLLWPILANAVVPHKKSAVTKMLLIFPPVMAALDTYTAAKSRHDDELKTDGYLLRDRSSDASAIATVAFATFSMSNKNEETKNLIATALGMILVNVVATSSLTNTRKVGAVVKAFQKATLNQAVALMAIAVLNK
jgi:hypothetical protein